MLKTSALIELALLIPYLVGSTVPQMVQLGHHDVDQIEHRIVGIEIALGQQGAALVHAQGVLLELPGGDGPPT